MRNQQICRGQTCAAEALQAVSEFHAAVMQSETELVLFFCSSTYDLDLIAQEMRRLFVGIQVVGCTSAGEIGPSGYRRHGLSGVSFPPGSCVAVSGMLDNLSRFELTKGYTFAQNVLRRLEEKIPGADANNSFGLLLIDGMSEREEPVTHALQQGLGKIPLVGGSAADDLKFDKTHVYFNGRFHTDSAVMVLVSTFLPFMAFKTQHLVVTDIRFVVTEADTDQRIIREINGFPAAEEYARLVGLQLHELDSVHFATSLVVVMIDGVEYVRSIKNANPDGSLTFFCAIEDGLVLRLARGANLVQNLEQTFESIRAKIGAPQLVVGFDCAFRMVEIQQHGWSEQIGAIFCRNNVVGFNSYGEQIHGIHVNQTLTGLAIGTYPNLGEGHRDGG